MEVPTLEDLIILSRDEPVLYRALQLHQRGDVTLVHALMAAIILMSDELKTVRGLYKDLLSRQPPDPFRVRL